MRVYRKKYLQPRMKFVNFCFSDIITVSPCAGYCQENECPPVDPNSSNGCFTDYSLNLFPLEESN